MSPRTKEREEAAHEAAAILIPTGGSAHTRACLARPGSGSLGHRPGFRPACMGGAAAKASSIVVGPRSATPRVDSTPQGRRQDLVSITQRHCRSASLTY